jgi:hypothetical protein
VKLPIELAEHLGRWIQFAAANGVEQIPNIINHVSTPVPGRAQEFYAEYVNDEGELLDFSLNTQAWGPETNGSVEEADLVQLQNHVGVATVLKVPWYTMFGPKQEKGKPRWPKR